MKPPNKILLLHIKKLKGYISLVTFETKEEIIHELRVEFKKTRALLRLADGDNNKLKVPKVLKEFYTAAGRVRELQLQQQLIKDCCGEDNLPAYFKISFSFAGKFLNIDKRSKARALHWSWKMPNSAPSV